MIGSVLTVTQVNTFLKSLIESDGRLNDFFMAGEISNFTDHYRSGHLYFSLKDEKSVVKAVMFSSAAVKLKFKPASGMKVIVRGRVSVYEPSGQYQVYVQSMQPEGIGALSLAYEQLKARLAEEGLFDEAAKKPLPPYPRRIGVITSPTGAAVRDICQILARRWPLAEVILYPVLVQGEGAPLQLTRALTELDAESLCNVIIIGRGGGSYEDLQAFNDEGLARAVFACRTPVISAVGHETDFTICDFVADLRAPTPSAAAELCTPDGEKTARQLAAYREYFTLQAQRKIESTRQTLDYLLADSPLSSPERILANPREKAAGLTDSLAQAVHTKLERTQTALQMQAARLESLNPLRVLLRGYSVVEKADGAVVRKCADVKAGERLSIRLSDGIIQATVEQEDAL